MPDGNTFRDLLSAAMSGDDDARAHLKDIMQSPVPPRAGSQQPMQAAPAARGPVPRWVNQHRSVRSGSVM
jgi:hypothetical protein